MKTYSNIADFPKTIGTVLTLGTFDGVHLGHTKILNKITEAAKIMDLESVVLTFHPHPRSVLQTDTPMHLLSCIDEKSNLISNAGIDHLVIHPFDKAFSQLTAEEFVTDILVKKFNLKKIVIGYDHRFGKNRTANIDDLTRFGAEFGFEVVQITAEEVNAITISSTKIRKALETGNCSAAQDYLGHPYTLSGTVVKGQQLGRTLGFPTANLQPCCEEKLIPKNGVYVVRVSYDNRCYSGVLNIGNRPTVSGATRTIEVHLFDFSQEIYDAKLSLEFLKFLREEQRFESLDALKNQIINDKEQAIAYFQNLPK
ncbi:bifunctional riboflavin kinase/FAD synthetase [Flavobacterium sp.]|uniref:bifunctional riboflavin kinase/FAD synthetase n=1 Tax=Flavobacterium sp. TaxID=239 RepID=UPI002637A73A|nr:bifunctional riboflavin kinase/FAD synthetase [Flavobacterium sp.]